MSVPHSDLSERAELLDMLLLSVGHEARKFGGDYRAAVSAASLWIDMQLIDRTDAITRAHRLQAAIEEHRRRRGTFAVWKGDRALWAALDSLETDEGQAGG
jgi:hypothetical protein